MTELSTQAGGAPEPFGASSDLAAISPLLALSPLDGRYARQAADLRVYFSEFALMRYRFTVEIEWLIFVLTELGLASAPKLDAGQIRLLRSWVAAFDESDAVAIKRCELKTRHDVKAVEYYIGEKLTGAGEARLIPFVHLCCTSEDINNVSHAYMLRGGLTEVWAPALEKCIAALARFARASVEVPMLSRTHGQPASPTTLGKELAVFVHRLRRQAEQLRTQTYLVKFSGAVGNFNAHVAAYPEIDWREASARFLRGFGFEPNPITTQIEPHDWMAEVFGLIVRVNSILIDLDRDIWSYVSLGYLRQRLYEGEVGSSTMPHKINPIDFENSEANAGLSTAILGHLATKLPISRMQRDLSDSAAIRAVGTGVGHGLLALKACLAGLNKIDVDEPAIGADLERNWAVLAEAIQTVMRKHGVEDAYEQIKAATQSQQLDAEAIRRLVEATSIPEPDRGRLLSLTPAGFVGAAAEIARAVLDRE